VSKSTELGIAGDVPADETEELFSNPYSRLLNKRELSKFLGKHPNTIDYLRSKRVIPFYRIGGSIMFRLKEVETALQRFRVREVSL